MTDARTIEFVGNLRLVAGQSKRRAWALAPGRVVEAIEVGSDAMCDWPLAAPGVAPRHARLAFDGACLWITAISAATHAVLVDGRALGDDWTELHVGDVVTLGGATLRAAGASDGSERNDDSADADTNLGVDPSLAGDTILGVDAGATSDAESDVPNRPTLPPTAIVGLPDTELVDSPTQINVVDPLAAEATRIELPLPSRMSRERTPSPQLGAAASGVRPVPVALGEQHAPATAAPMESTHRVDLPSRSGLAVVRVVIAAALFALVALVAMSVGVWRWLANDAPQSLATTPETAARPPAPPMPPPIAAGRLPEVAPISPPPIPAEGSELARAVALVAEGRVSEAALAYEQLSLSQPTSRELALVARALRARARGGAP